MEYNPYRALTVLGYDPEDPKALKVYQDLIDKGELRSPSNDLGVTRESLYAYLRRQREVKQKQVEEIVELLKQLNQKTDNLTTIMDNLTAVMEKLQVKAEQEDRVEKVKY